MVEYRCNYAVYSLMGRRKKKVGCGEHIDRISDLPSNVIDSILQHLPIEDLVKTSVLSRKWRLWAEERGDNIERTRVSDLLKDLPKIKRLSLEGGYIQNLSAGMQLRSVNTLTYLALYGVNFNEVGELLFTISLLESSPNLKELVIQGDYKNVEPQTTSKEFDCSDCCFSQLQIVNITVKTGYKHALNLIRYVLAKSSSLKILTFKVYFGLNQSDTPILLSISRDLLRMERASPRAEVRFLYDGLIE